MLAASRPRAFRRNSRRVILVASLALAAVAVVRWSTLGSSPAPLSPAPPGFAQMPYPVGLLSRPFSTVGPAGWSVSASFPASGVTDYQLSNARSGIPDSAVIPPPGAIEIQITNVSPAGVAGYLGRPAGSQLPLQLLRYFQRPLGATNVIRLVAAQSAKVGGIAAARDAYSYAYRGSRGVQTELVLRHGGTVVSIQVNAAPALEPMAINALSVVLAHWVWYGPAHPAPPAPRLPVPLAVPPAPSPTGQWIASGFVDFVGGDVADAYLDKPEVRSWEFIRMCTTGASCRTEIVRQLRNGGTLEAPLEQIRGSTWWRATFPVTSDSCARVPGIPPRRETVTDTIELAWSSVSQHRQQLIANETETINGCGGPTPGKIDDHWTAAPVPQPPPLPISLNPAHAASASAFRSAALRVCTRVNNEATPLAVRISAAEATLRSPASRTIKAAAAATIATQFAAVPRLWVEEYSQIPQPPSGPLDTLWLQDLAANRQQLGPVTAAISALHTAALAMSRYFATASDVQQQTAIAESTLFVEDIVQSAGPGTRSNTLEHELKLPTICINPSSINSIFETPTLT